MKNKQIPLLKPVLTLVALQLALMMSLAQSNFVAFTFDDELEVIDNNGQPWQNWFGTAYLQSKWVGTNAVNDANGDTNSGALCIEAFYPDSGEGGCCGPQFLAMNGYDGFSPPLAGNGNAGNVPVVTNIAFDVRFDPITDLNGSTDWPTIEVGTRGDSFSQFTFGTFTIPASSTNWVHVDIPVAPNPDWANIPHIYFKHWSGTRTNWVVLYVDNIVFTLSEVDIAPPTMTISEATPALRMYAGNGQYARTQVATVDTNQSWVGGTYPVSYSFTVSHYDIDPSINEFHMFLIPLNHVQAGAGLNQYTDYSTASNNFRLQIVGGDYGTAPVTAQLAYKTNAINANPDQVVANLTNDTAIGTWTVSFTSATAGTLTAPGSSAVPFSLPSDVAATFANPLVAFFGVQPNDPANLGQQMDFTHIQTVNVPGTDVNTDFTTGAPIDTNIWLAASVSDDESNLVIVGGSDAWWLEWGFPDTGFGLGSKAELNSAVAWKTPEFFMGYDTNNPIFSKTLGSRVSRLIPTDALPTLDGTTNGATGADAFFRLESPPPAE